VYRRVLVRLAMAVAILVAIALVGGATGVVVGVRRSLPDYDGEASLSGLTAKVQIHRDAHGIPQVYADTPEDLFRAQGYVHAQDRFYEMDFRRHLTAGRLAEWFGEELVETDALVRTLGWRRTAARELSTLSPQVRGYLQAYAEGVNAYLAEHSGSRLSVEYTFGALGPPERPEPWTPVDSLAWLKAMAWDLRSNLDDEIDRALTAARLPEERVAELYPEYPYDRHPPIVAVPPSTAATIARRPPLPAGTEDALRRLRALLDASALPDSAGVGAGLGSNSWVVSGALTVSGKPLLANDPHLAPGMPGIWYQIGLHCRRLSDACRYDVAGFGFAGLPGVVIGHNDRIAWGFTNLGPDVMDLYVERLDNDTYLYDEGRRPLTVRQETIRVRDAQPVRIRVRSTHHGPLLSDVHEEVRRAVARTDIAQRARAGGYEVGVALRWTALEPGTTAEAIFRLNTARDWDDFRAAAALFDVPAQNMVYADVEGNIGYQAPGRIPIRRGGTGQWPVPGWSSRFEWEGWVPFEHLPHLLNPKEGFIVTANNAVATPSYPYRLADFWDYGYRADRISKLVRDRVRRGQLDVEAMREIQLDTYDANAAFLVPYLRRIRVDEFTAEGQALLDGWAFTQEVESPAAAFFNAVWRNLLVLTFHDDLPAGVRPNGGDRWYEVVRRLVADPDNPWWDDRRTKDVKEDRDTILRQAMVEARKELTRIMARNPERWSWGRMHQLTLVNPSFGNSGFPPLERLFNRGPFEMPGGSEAVLSTGWHAERGYAVTSVPSMRMVVDLGDFDRSGWVNLTGVSGHPSSRHYTDQLEAWLGGRLLPWAFSQAAVQRAAHHVLVLNP
jgi:penicillin amidase